MNGTLRCWYCSWYSHLSDKVFVDCSLSMSRKRERQSGQSSLDFAFPPELKETLNRLYHLRRGPLISPGPMRSMDDRAEIRGLFLRFPLEDCLQMMAPSMWSTGVLAGITSAWDVMEPFPAETLALWDCVSCHIKACRRRQVMSFPHLCGVLI